MWAGKSQLAGASICCNMAVNGDSRMLRKKRDGVGQSLDISENKCYIEQS